MKTKLNVIKCIGMLFVCLILSGCSTPYKATITSNKAFMRITATPNSSVGLTAVHAEHLSNKDCRKSERRLIAFLNNSYVFPGVPGSNHNDLGIPGGENIPLNIKHEFEIQANQEFTFLLKRPRPGPTATAGTVVIVPNCVTALSFIPEVGAQYEAAYNYNSSSCSMVISKIDKVQNEAGFIRTKVEAEELDCKI